MISRRPVRPKPRCWRWSGRNRWADTANAWLRIRLIGVVVAILVVGFGATSVMSYRDAVRALKTTILHNELPLTGSNIYSEVQSDLIRPVFISSQMATDTFVKDWLIAGEQGSDRIVRYLEAIREKYGVFTSFLISDATRRYYHFSGRSRSVDEKSPDDVWYFRVKAMTAPYEINIDYDQASDRTVAIFVNYRVLDYDGKFLGVTGVGLNIDSVKHIVERYRTDFRRTVYFIDKTGMVTVTSAEAPHSGVSIRNLPGMGPIADRILNAPEGQFEYERDGESYLLDTRYIPELGWYVVVEQAAAEATKELWSSLVMNLWVGFGIIFLTAGTVAGAVAVYHRKLDVMATTDKLTGLANRQVFDARIAHLLRSRRRGFRPFALLLCDIDHFKQINDTLGHLRGDEVIRSVAEATMGVLRETDVVCRWGGEELIILAHNCEMEDAIELAEGLRATIADRALFTPDDGTRVTVSIGVTAYAAGDSMDMMLARVDKALYRAKREGRNCVRAAHETTPPASTLVPAE
ncbi:MAG: diguanylate cyclase [Acetobacteraceae bacterium]